MAELTRENMTAAARDGRLEYTPCPRPADPLVGVPQAAFTKVSGWVTNLFRDTEGRHYVRAVKGAEVRWLHITVNDPAAPGARGA